MIWKQLSMEFIFIALEAHANACFVIITAWIMFGSNSTAHWLPRAWMELDCTQLEDNVRELQLDTTVFLYYLIRRTLPQ